MKNWKKRAVLVAAAVALVAGAALLVLNALDSNIALYITPSEVAAGKAPQQRDFRIGGLVKGGSLRRDNLTVHFVVTDTVREVAVRYTGILPDLFREGQGAVVQGRLAPDGSFVATEVLAKHDEKYMPPAAQHAVDAARNAQGGRPPQEPQP